MSLDSLRVIYYSYFHSLLSYGVIFWGNSVNNKIVFKIQKRVIRLMTKKTSRSSCRHLFRQLHILPLPSLYIFEVLLYVKKNISNFQVNSQIHCHDTRNSNKLSIITHNTTWYEGSFIYNGISLYNSLPYYIKCTTNFKGFKNKLSVFMYEHSFYSIEEFREQCKNVM